MLKTFPIFVSFRSERGETLSQETFQSHYLTLQRARLVSQTRMTLKKYVCDVVWNQDILELIKLDFTSCLPENIYKIVATEKINRKKIIRVCET